jgi:hypothetical protein
MIDIDEARRLGFEHGWQTGDVMDREAVRACWVRWTADEVDAYFRGRAIAAGLVLVAEIVRAARAAASNGRGRSK